jgi:hypothetical protein
MNNMKLWQSYRQAYSFFGKTAFSWLMPFFIDPAQRTEPTVAEGKDSKSIGLSILGLLLWAVAIVGGITGITRMISNQTIGIFVILIWVFLIAPVVITKLLKLLLQNKRQKQ